MSASGIASGVQFPVSFSSFLAKRARVAGAGRGVEAKGFRGANFSRLARGGGFFSGADC